MKYLISTQTFRYVNEYIVEAENEKEAKAAVRTVLSPFERIEGIGEYSMDRLTKYLNYNLSQGAVLQVANERKR